jgi:hypothetical protein
MFLVWSHFNVVGPDSGLYGGWVVEALHVGEVWDVECGDVVGGCEGEVGKFAVLSYIWTVSEVELVVTNESVEREAY